MTTQTQVFMQLKARGWNVVEADGAYPWRIAAQRTPHSPWCLRIEKDGSIWVVGKEHPWHQDILNSYPLAGPVYDVDEAIATAILIGIA